MTRKLFKFQFHHVRRGNGTFSALASLGCLIYKKYPDAQRKGANFVAMDLIWENKENFE